MVKPSHLFYVILLVVTIAFSIIGFTPSDVVIVGPSFPQENYFIEELDLISKKTGYKITYVTLNDVSYYLYNNPKKADLAIITNPSFLHGLSQSEIILPANKYYFESSSEIYSQYLLNLISSYDNSIIYGHWIRLFSNSMIWYNVDRYKELGSPKFNSFDELIEYTESYSTDKDGLWCLSIDSAENQPLLDYEYGESSGWIVSNWLENIVLANYGPEIYDKWIKNEIQFSDSEVILSLLDIGKLIHNEKSIYKGKEYLIRSQVSSSAVNLIDEESKCVFSLMGHDANSYMPKNVSYGEDYDFLYFPSTDFTGMVVGIGDTLTLLNYDSATTIVYQELVSSSFGESWANKINSEFVSARTDFDDSKYSNGFAKKQYKQIQNSLSLNLFRFDGSMLMKNGTGKKILWTSLRKFTTLSNHYLEEIAEEIDTRIKRELEEK